MSLHCLDRKRLRELPEVEARTALAALHTPCRYEEVHHVAFKADVVVLFSLVAIAHSLILV